MTRISRVRGPNTSSNTCCDVRRGIKLFGTLRQRVGFTTGRATLVLQLATQPSGRWYLRRYTIRLFFPRETNSKIISLLPSSRALPCLLDAERTNQRPATISYVPLSLSIL